MFVLTQAGEIVNMGRIGRVGIRKTYRLNDKAYVYSVEADMNGIEIQLAVYDKWDAAVRCMDLLFEACRTGTSLRMPAE